MIMQTGGNNNQQNENYNEQEQQNQVQEQYYEETTYEDEAKGSSKKTLIIGAIVVIIILLLLLLFVFGGKKKTVVDNNNSLKNIIVEGAELEPAFNQDVLEYELRNPSETIRITCQASSENATVEGCDLNEITTAELTEDIEITVKAANGDEKKYVIKVNSGYDGIKFTVSGNDSEWSNKPVTLTVDATSVNPLADEAYSFDGGSTWQSEKSKTYQESTIVVVKVRDNEGNISAPQTIEIKIDKNSKVLIKKVNGETDEWTAGEVVLTVEAISENSLHEKAYSFDGGKTWQSANSKTFTEMADVNIVVRDERENKSEVKTVKVKIDKTTPTVKITGSVASGKSTTNSVVLKAETNNSPSGYKYQWYKNSSAISGATKSTYTATTSGSYTVKVTNGVGKSKTSSTYQVNKVTNSGGGTSNPGTTTPTSGTVSITSVSGNATDYTKKDVTLKVNATASKGLNSKAYSFDNGKTWQSSNTKTFTSNQTVYIVVRDKDGKTASKTININKIDKEAPLVTFSINGNSTAAKSVVTKVTVKDNGVGKLGTLYYALVPADSKKQPEFVSPFKSGDEIKVTSFANTSGTYTLLIKAVDSLGNETITKSNKYIIDNEAPSKPTVELYKWKENTDTYKPSSITNLNSATKYTVNTWSNRYITAFVKPTDNGIDHYEYVLSGESGKSFNGAVQKGNYWHFQANGDSNIKFRACDIAGNCSVYTDTYKVRIDTKAPTVTFNPPSAGTYPSGKVVSATCSDSGSGITSMITKDTQYSTDTKTYSSTTAVKSQTQSITLVSTAQNRTITVTCKDALGNEVTKESPKYNITTNYQDNKCKQVCDTINGYIYSGNYDSNGKCEPIVSGRCGRGTNCKSCTYKANCREVCDN